MNLENMETPEVIEETQLEENNYFITRQPILEEGKGIFAYEICSQNTVEHDAVSDGKMLFNLLSTIGHEKLAENNLLFLNAEISSLSKAYNKLSSNGKIVMELHHDKCTDSVEIANTAECLKDLVQKGYRFAGNPKTLSGAYQSWQPYIEFIKIPIINDTTFLKKLIHFSKLKNKTVIMEKVETPEQHSMLLDLGIKYFQGYYFCKPKKISTKIMNPNVERIVKLMKLATKNARIDELEDVFKLDPDLSFRLLKYMNSVGVGGMREITSLRFALNVLGYQNLFKWLTILLSMANRDKSYGSALTRTALIRAKFMELLATHYENKEHGDSCFLIGMFSLLDAMLNIPLEEVIKQVELPEKISESLIHQTGAYATYLKFAVALEQNDWIDILGLSKVSGFSEEVANEKFSEAVDWTDQLGIM